MGNISSLKDKKKVKASKYEQNHSQTPPNDEPIEEMLCSAILDENVLELQRLIDQGANLNYPCQDEYFPLAFACYFGKGHLKIVKTLVENGAELESLNEKNLTPLMLSMAKGYTEIVEYLISKGSNVNHRIPSGYYLEESPLSYAVHEGLFDFAKILLDNGAKVGSLHPGRPLMYKALDEENYDIADLLIEKGAKIDARDFRGFTPLFYAVYDQKAAIVKSLIDRDANVNIEVPYKKARFSPLMIAVNKGAIDIVEILADNEADVNYQTAGTTVLGLAVSHGHLEIAKILIECEASIEIAHCGKALLDIAMEKEHYDVAKLLIEEGAYYDDEFNPYLDTLIEKCHLAMVKYFIELRNSKKPKKKDDNYNYTPDTIFVWCMIPSYGKRTKEHSEKIVDFLMENGFTIDKDWGISPLHLAISMGQNEIAKQLIKHGSDVNFLQDDNDTPLHQAILIENAELCKLLLDKGAKYDIKGPQDLTAFELAKEMQLDDIIDLIIEKMTQSPTPDKDGVPSNTVQVDDCVICYAPRKEVFVFHPCGHAKTCERCALKILHKSHDNATCPVCRANITDLKKVFL